MATRKSSALRRVVHGSLLGLVLLGSAQSHAALVDNQQLAQQAQVELQRDTVHSMLARADVRAALLEYGVSEASVERRVNQLTGEELQQMQSRLAELPAGADSGVGLILGIIFIFIVLDLLGATDVFPRI